MQHLAEANVENFKWGNKKGVGRINKDVNFYDSFTYEGVDYFLYDCIYFYRTGDLETSIGKLVKIYETPTHEKKVKVVWFFRPIEIRNFLGDDKPQWNEVFLASGQGTGLSNINFLEDVIGKCNIICTSMDKRNPQASIAELKKADYIFYRTFDVGNFVIREKFADAIAGIKVEHFFNGKKDQENNNSPCIGTNLKQLNERSHLSSKLDKVVRNPAADCKVDAGKESAVKASKRATDMEGDKISFLDVRPKPPFDSNWTKPCISENQVKEKTKVRCFESVLSNSTPKSYPYKKRKIVESKSSSSQSRGPIMKEYFEVKERTTSDKAAVQLQEDKSTGQILEVTRRPEAERRNWFKNLPWEERLQRAQEVGTLVLLNNLDPSYTSAEVEDLVWHAFNQKVEAKMISSTFSGSHYGKAFVIFKSKVAAEFAMSELNRRCLLLGDGRVVTASKGTVRAPGNTGCFSGHLIIDKVVLQKQRDEMKNAVSTSHCSQPNTIEYEMALQWQVLQHKSDAWWKALYQKQRAEIQNCRSRLKKDYII
ncbi:Bromo-adjacent domain-containing protein, putative isoform 1 [Quillaja saponaria]|uniref:Bromo-adjacent domain-containing protein, putative isoform 1 n=1 Tax=Quillaja saponaria TaxID=32244 RepID=A0AAD7PEI8_QUISA|nr:Bromo-adjacent domain-containing protein, putative isoform 1 [Quillaja saponaria]